MTVEANMFEIKATHRTQHTAHRQQQLQPLSSKVIIIVLVVRRPPDIAVPIRSADRDQPSAV